MARKRAAGPGPQPRVFAGRRLPLAVSESPVSLYGIGVDILRLERIEKIWKRHGQRLAEKILSAQELKDFAQSKNPVRFLTMAFAAKEACVKALGTGFEGVAYSDAGTHRNAQGRPMLHFSARGKRLLRNRGIASAHVSLSDEGGMVCAMVVMEKAARKTKNH